MSCLKRFLPPKATHACSNTQLLSCLCSLGTDLTLFEDPDGCIYGMVKDFPCFEIFLSEYEAFTYADFCTHNTPRKKTSRPTNFTFAGNQLGALPINESLSHICFWK